MQLDMQLSSLDLNKNRSPLIYIIYITSQHSFGAACVFALNRVPTRVEWSRRQASHGLEKLEYVEYKTKLNPEH